MLDDPLSHNNYYYYFYILNLNYSIMSSKIESLLKLDNDKLSKELLATR